jgi:hypothetical protein
MPRHILVDEVTGTLIHRDTTVKDFRGHEAIVRGFQEPRHRSSTGRVTLSYPGEPPAEYFPSVIGARIVQADYED